MKRMVLACCKIYVSESRNLKVLGRIEQAAAVYSRKAPILHTFKDEHYNRVGYTLAGEFCENNVEESPAPALHDAVVSIVGAAVDIVDINRHSGSHPRIGAVDNVCFHPLEGSLDHVAKFARRCASTIGSNFQVPVFLYGAASEEGRALVDLRRSLGYFANHTRREDPDFGPRAHRGGAGVITLGATHWISNYNVPLATSDLQTCRGIARDLVAACGNHVQAMALPHGDDCVEIACNLLDERLTAATTVQSCVQSLAASRGLPAAAPGYCTGPAQDSVLQHAISNIRRNIS